MNALPVADASRALQHCCGSTRWARMMAAARPFATADAMAATADAVWAGLDRADWLEAFAAHPRIGVGGPGRAGGAGTEAWSAQEQSGVTDDSRAQLVRLNREYESKFGYIFIVCATGKSGDEMLDTLERRMRNNPDDEIREAAEQQRQITRLRLRKLIAD